MNTLTLRVGAVAELRARRLRQPLRIRCLEQVLDRGAPGAWELPVEVSERLRADRRPYPRMPTEIDYSFDYNCG